VGSVPGVLLGAVVSSRAPDSIVRPVLVVVLLASGLKLAGVSNASLGLILLAAALAAIAYIAIARRQPAKPSSILAAPRNDMDAVQVI
jgi:uncharacterized protein